MRDTFIARLVELAREDPRVMLVTADLGFAVLDGFIAEFPDRFVNVGVAEQTMTGLAVGLALAGKIVFTYSIANFPTLRCLEQLRNDACYHGVNVNVVAVGGGFSYGQLGFSHHATEDLAILRALPGVTVVSPGDLWEVGHATTALCRTPGVGYLRLDKLPAPRTPTAEVDAFALGKIRTLRQGSDVALVATGGVLGEALAAADTLALAHDLEARVLSVHTLKPIDAAAIVDAARSVRALVTIEEGTIVGGLGGAVAEVCTDAGVAPRRFRRLGLHDVYSTAVGTQQYLRTLHGLDAPHIVATTLALLGSDPDPAGIRT